MTLDPELKKEFKKIRANQKTIALFVLLVGVIVILLSVPADAQTITMSNPGASNSRDIMVYYPNGSMQGFYNDTSVITLDANESYIFTLKPLSSNPLTDPTDWLNNHAFPFVQSNAIAIIFICFVVGYLIMRGAR
ncbi:MAG: hypothetical protein WC356_05575 [Candidatus Micrarchaeia archaeon]|jgi:hypothetical protein